MSARHQCEACTWATMHTSQQSSKVVAAAAVADSDAPEVGAAGTASAMPVLVFVLAAVAVTSVVNPRLFLGPKDVQPVAICLIWCRVVQSRDDSPHNFDGLAMLGLAFSVAPCSDAISVK